MSTIPNPLDTIEPGREQFSVPFGQSSEFVLASRTPPSCFNFYPSLEHAAADADRANGKRCRCGHVFTDADAVRPFDGRKIIDCSVCGKSSYPDHTYEPMTWDEYRKAQRDCYLGDVPVQITREKFNYALEVLPPDAFEHKGNIISFLMCEHYSGPYTSQYVAKGHGHATTYWTKMVDASDRSTWMTAESLAHVPPITPEVITHA